MNPGSPDGTESTTEDVVGSAARYMQIANDLRHRIEASELLPGQTLPTVRQLAHQYGVTTQTVAKATKHLVERGLIETRHGAGSRVAGPSGAQQKQKQKSATLVTLVHAELLFTEGAGGSLSNQWFDTSLNAITRVAGAMELKTQVLGFKVNDTTPAPAILDAVERALGVLILGDPPPVYYSLLKDTAVPVCFFNRPVPQELVDHAVSVRSGITRYAELVDYVLSLGHRKVLFVWDTDPEYENAEVSHRRSILREQMVRWGLDPDSRQADLDISTRPRDYAIAEVVRTLVEDGYTAAVCYNDASAIRLYRVLHYLGIAIPEEVSVVGFDGIQAGELLSPPLSTVRIDMMNVASQAIRSIKMIREGLLHHKELLLPGELTIRRSATLPRKKVK